MRSFIVACLLLLTTYAWAALPEGECLSEFLNVSTSSPEAKTFLAAYQMHDTTIEHAMTNGRGLGVEIKRGYLSGIVFSLRNGGYVDGQWTGRLPFTVQPADSSQKLKKRFGKPAQDYLTKERDNYAAQWAHKGFYISVGWSLLAGKMSMEYVRIDSMQQSEPVPVPVPGCPPLSSIASLVAQAAPPPPRPPPRVDPPAPPPPPPVAALPPSRPPPPPAPKMIPIGQFESEPGAPPLAITSGRTDYGPIADIDDTCQGFYSELVAAIGCIAPEIGRGDAKFSIKEHGQQPTRLWCGQIVPAGYWVQYGGMLYVYARAQGSRAPSCRKLPEYRPSAPNSQFKSCSYGVLCDDKCCNPPYRCYRDGPGVGVKRVCY